MIDLIKKVFSKKANSDTVREQENAHDIRIATSALLLEMSNIDGEFSDSERRGIVSILKRDYALSDEHADSLIETAHEELMGSIDLWQFTNLINQNYSEEEKIQIIEMIWRVAYTDGTLDKHEDFLAHKLATLLRLSHKQLIEAKLRAKKNVHSDCPR